MFSSPPPLCHHIRWRLQAAALHDTQQNMKLVNWYVDKIQSVVQIQKYFNKILSSLLHQFQCDHDHNFSSYLPLYIRPGPPSCSGLGKHGVWWRRHLIHKQMKWFYSVGNTWFGSILVSGSGNNLQLKEIQWNMHRKNKTRPYGLKAAMNRHDVCKFTLKFWHFDINGQEGLARSSNN